MIILTTLGTPEILVGETSVTPAGERTFAALLYLCVERGRPVRRKALQSMIFPATGASEAAHSLRQTLYRLGRAGAPIERATNAITLPAEAVRHDLSGILARGSLTNAERAAVRSGYLAGFAPTFSEAYSMWLNQHRDAVSIQLRRMLVEQIAWARLHHDWPAMADAAQTCLVVDPRNEEATLALSETLAMVGSKTEAVAVLDTFTADVGEGSPELKRQSTVLRRRIAERMPVYSAKASRDVPLVGRQVELGRLHDTLALIRSRTPRIVRLSGEAGIGKTRLVEEFERLATLEGARIVTVRAHPSDVRRPLSAFYDAVPRLLALPGALGCAPESMQFLRRFDRLRSSPPATIPDEERDAELLFANITLAIQDLLAAVASESTLLVIIEDAHWLDEHSTRLIEDALRSRESLALGLILTVRTDRTGAPKAETAPDVIAIDLGPLDATNCQRLVGLLLTAPEKAPPELRAWLATTAAGSPLYADLLVQHFETTGEAFKVPLSLSTLIALQLDQLSPMARKIIETVTMLGRYATIERLRQVLGLPRFEFLSSVQELEDRRLLRLDGQEVRTAHALLDDSVTEKMRPLVASVLHRDVATLLESEMSPDSAHVPWDAAVHWQQAGETGRAIAAMRTCARQALAVGQPGEACEVLERLSRGQLADSTLRRAIYEELVDVAEATAEWRSIPEAVEHLIADGGSAALKRSRDEYILLRFEAFSRTGQDFASGREVLFSILVDDAAKPALRLRAATLIVERADVTNEARDVDQARNVVAALAARQHTSLPEMSLIYFQLVYHTSFGDLDEVDHLADRVVALASVASPPGMRARLLLNAAWSQVRIGGNEKAEQLLEQVAADAGENRLPALQVSALAQLAYLALLDDRRARAWECLEKAEVILVKRRSSVPPGPYCWSRAILLTLEERFDEAREWIQQTETNLPGIKTGKARLSTDALRLLIRAGRGEPLQLIDVQPVLDSYEAMKGASIDDIVVVGIATALVHCGAAEHSASVAHDYLTNWRRSRIRPSAQLRVLAAQHPASRSRD